MSDTVDVEISACEVDLLLAYVWAMDDELDQLQRFKGIPVFNRLTIDCYWISGFMADLAYHSRQIEDKKLLDEIDELFTVLETAQMRC